MFSRTASDVLIPQRQTINSAGYDLHAYESVSIPPHERKLISTGIQLAIPVGCYGQICSRSGLALKYGIICIAGVIDSDYRGTVGVLLYNTSNTTFEVKKGDRIAQLIIIPILTPTLLEASSLEKTERGEGGFGSTGV